MGISKKRPILGASKLQYVAKQRAEELEYVLKRLNELTASAPAGKLRVQKRGKTFQYYLRTSGADTEGIYICKKNCDVARKISQYEYDTRIIEVLERELDGINKMLEVCGEENVYSVLSSMHEGKQKLVNPIALSDAAYMEQWKSVEYPQMGFTENDNSDYFTSKGERVRSKSEIVIADALTRKGVPYRYEYPVELSGFGTVRPDFTCLNIRSRKEIIWEHFGLMSDYDYSNKNVKKLDRYEMNGYFPGDNLIVTMETESCSLNTKLVDKLIEKYLV